MFEHMEISETMYAGVVEPSDKNLLGNMKTVMVTVEKKQDKPPHIRLTPRQVRFLSSAETDMKISRQNNRKPV